MLTFIVHRTQQQATWHDLLLGPTKVIISALIFPDGHFTAVCSLAAKPRLELNLMFYSVPGLPESCETARFLNWLLSLAHPWHAYCRSAPLFFFDSILEWLLENLHCIANSIWVLIVIYTDGSTIRVLSYWAFTVKWGGRTEHEDDCAYRITTSSLTIEVEAVTQSAHTYGTLLGVIWEKLWDPYGLPSEGPLGGW